MQTFPSIVFQMFALFNILLKARKMWGQTASSSIFPADAFLLKLVGIDVQQAEVTRKHILKRIFAILGGSLQIFLFILFVNVLQGISPDRMLLTDCYSLTLIGRANSTSTENEEAAVSKLWLVRNLDRPLSQGRCALFILRNNWGCTNKVSAEHYTAKIQ